MSPLVRKEVRSLLPPWALALVLAIVPVWLVWPGSLGIWAPNPGYLVQAPFALGVLLLSLTPFGQELNWGTFSVLLAQPVPRERIWRIKTLLLALALLLVAAAFLISIQVRVDTIVNTARKTELFALLQRPGGDRQLELTLAETRHAVLVGSFMVGGLGALSGFAGGLWAPLLFRQVSAAFWFTLLVPLGLALLSGYAGNIGTCIVLGTYSAVGYFWARKLFQKVQDTQWTGGVVSVPEWGRAAVGARAAIGQRRRHVIRALLRKELQAQSVNLLLSGGLLLVHFAIIALRRFGLEYLQNHRMLGMTLEAFPILWLAMPLLVGSAAIAEERKLGTFEAVSCLPVSRRLQFGLKAGLSLALGLFLGALVPAMIEHAGELLGLPANIPPAFGMGVSWITPIATLLFIASFGISLLSLYGSSLTRNTLQALGSGVLGCVVAALLVTVAAIPIRIYDISLWGPQLLGLILMPVMILTIIVLAYRNYRRVQPTAQVWGRNALVLLLVLLGSTGVTSAIYHRFWEAWLPVEPVHSRFVVVGSGEVVGGGVKAKVDAGASSIAVRLPDGRLWLRQRPFKLVKFARDHRSFCVARPTGRVHEGFVPGSNWRDVAVSDFDCFAIQTDGSLWDLSNVNLGGRDALVDLKQVGDSHDWEQIAAGGQHNSGIRKDGTLWEWGYRWAPDRQTQTGNDIPTQVGSDSNWVAVADSFQSSVAAKADGTIWIWGWAPDYVQTNRQAVTQPVKWLAFPEPRRPVSLSFNGFAVAAVCDNGTLWLGGQFVPQLLGGERSGQARREMARWGNSADWKQAAFPGTTRQMALKKDGTLFSSDLGKVMWHWGNWPAVLAPASEYPIWTSICSYRNAFLALGRDGKLCLWGDPEDNGYYDYNGPDPRRLLMPSRLRARELANLGR